MHYPESPKEAQVNSFLYDNVFLERAKYSKDTPWLVKTFRKKVACLGTQKRTILTYPHYHTKVFVCD